MGFYQALSGKARCRLTVCSWESQGLFRVRVNREVSSRPRHWSSSNVGALNGPGMKTFRAWGFEDFGSGGSGFGGSGAVRFQVMVVVYRLLAAPPS